MPPGTVFRVTGAYECSECNMTQNWVIVNASHQGDLSSIWMPEGAHERKITPAPTSQPLTEDPSQKAGVLPSGSLAKSPAVSTLGKLAPTPHSRRETMMICFAGVPVFAPQCQKRLAQAYTRLLDCRCVNIERNCGQVRSCQNNHDHHLPIMINYV